MTTAERSEEELRIDKVTHAVGRAQVRKHVDTDRVTEVVDRGIEEADVERAPADGNDSGKIETLADGSVSIPVFEERLVIEKRLVVRERVIIRKRTVVEEERVEAELRRERIDVVADEAVAARLHDER